ncbi:MAG: hypothetical protein WDN76_10845 [Alphaproteobacteria bacterium]
MIVARDGASGAELALANNPRRGADRHAPAATQRKDVIATLRPALPKATIVAMSAIDLDTTEQRREAENLGADLSLTKPFTIRNLLAGVEKRRLIQFG